jgi:alpha-beta hydrolase superfamily lysophospholipase
MVERREGHFKGHFDLDLFYQSWTRPPHNRGTATIVLTHGLAEHSDAYHLTALSLVAKGYDVFAWDLRGHGRSEGPRGYVADFIDYSRDLTHLVDLLHTRKQVRFPLVLLGHSMGGLVTLTYLLDALGSAEIHSYRRPAAVVLSSPLLGIELPVPAFKEAAARLIARLTPRLTLHNEIQFSDLTRRPELPRAYAADPLRHDRISAPLYFGMKAAIQDVHHGASRLRLPMLIQAAGQDRVVSTPATKRFFDGVGAEPKKLIVYEDSYHEIYNDLDRERCLDDLDFFLRAALDEGGN